MRARERLQDSDKKLERAMIELRTAVGEQLLPKFVEMVPVLRDAIPIITRLLAGFTNLAEWGMRNPLSGLSVLIGAAFAKELAMAAMGKMIENALMSTAGRSTLAVGSAVMAIAMAKMMIEQEFKDEADAQKNAVSRQIEAQNLITKINRGEGTAADTEKAQQLLDGLKKDREKQIDLRENPGLGKTASAAMANIIAPEQAKEAALAEEHNRQESIRMLSDSMGKLATAIDKNTRKIGDAETTGKPSGGVKPASATTGIVHRN
jgi:hypothetical protein